MNIPTWKKDYNLKAAPIDCAKPEFRHLASALWRRDGGIVAMVSKVREQSPFDGQM